MTQYRIACTGAIPRRHEAAAAKLPTQERHSVVWAVLVADDGAQAEALLTSAELQRHRIELADIPSSRILTRTGAPACRP